MPALRLQAQNVLACQSVASCVTRARHDAHVRHGILSNPRGVRSPGLYTTDTCKRHRVEIPNHVRLAQVLCACRCACSFWFSSLSS